LVSHPTRAGIASRRGTASGTLEGMNAAKAAAPGAVRIGYARRSTDEPDAVNQTEQLPRLTCPPDLLDEPAPGPARRNRRGLGQALAAV
jgi:hypothetical protein